MGISCNLTGLELRSRLGLTGKKAVEESKPVEASGKAKSKAPAKSKKPAKLVEQAPASSNGSHGPLVASTATGHDDDILDELEEGIDDLIQKIRELGGKPEVVKALKRVRRLLLRSHEG